jgi:hypothetical protein
MVYWQTYRDPALFVTTKGTCAHFTEELGPEP